MRRSLLPCRTGVAALVLSAAAPLPLLAAAVPPATTGLVRIPAEEMAWEPMASGRRDLATGYPVALYRVDHPVTPAAPETMARQYLAEQAQLLGLDPDLGDLVLHAVRTNRAVTTVRFRQVHRGIPVYAAEVTVTLSHEPAVVFVMNGYRPGLAVERTAPAVSLASARTAALGYLDMGGAQLYLDRGDLIVYGHGARPAEPGGRLAHRLLLGAADRPGEWEVLVDAATGEVFRAEDKASYGTPTVVDGSGQVFLPDPLSSAGASYGNTGFTDAGDADTAQLTGEVQSVTLREIREDSGVFSLVGPWAEIIDFAAPFKGLFTQGSSAFNFTRNADAFEAANTYYHIDTFMRYMNITLGIPVEPYQYPGGVQFDPSGFNGADNSSYSTGTGRLQFGEGGVDDAEDADVIIHELGHGIHDWVTVGGLSQVQGLSEGVGDYFAASYSRSFGQWAPTDPQYYWVFDWDGHNEFWNGRLTNWTDTRTYPDDLVGQIHTDGQFWSSCNMQIWDAIGQEKTDSAMLVGLGMTNGGSNQLDAAQAVLEAGEQLGFPGADLTAMASIYQGCGYNVQPLTLIFADGFESGNTSAWSNAVP
jgi:hypothetical protein